MQIPQIISLGLTDYSAVYAAMRRFTEQRQPQTQDQIWFTEHHAVYTLGLAADSSHVLNAGSIPVVNVDRGGQVTYHGPGQLVVYPLLELRRYGLKVREYVQLLEQVLIDTLGQLGVQGACRKPGAPGVYVPVEALQPAALDGLALEGLCVGSTLANAGLAKIAALGIKLRQGCSYHGFALNVNMNLQPFLGINPCGYEGLQTTDLKATGVRIEVKGVLSLLRTNLVNALQCALLGVQTS